MIRPVQSRSDAFRGVFVLATLAVLATSVEGAPITVNLVPQRVRFTCDLVANTCADVDHSRQLFTFTYDPVEDPDIGGGVVEVDPLPGWNYAVQDGGEVDFTTTLPKIDVPWDETEIISFSNYARLDYFSAEPVNDYNLWLLNLLVWDFTISPSPDQTYIAHDVFRYSLQFSGPVPTGDPATDFYNALTHKWRPGDYADFYYGSYIVKNGDASAYQPGSMAYHGERVPEPTTGALAIVALAGVAWRRRARSRG
jgi:hypothetical protein